MKIILPQPIDGDLLNLVHLSSIFRMLDGASPLHVDNVVTTEVKIASVIDTDVGKTVKVIGNIIHEGMPATSNTFEIVQEPDYVAEYPTNAFIDVLLSKEWLELRDQSKPLTAGTPHLRFEVRDHIQEQGFLSLDHRFQRCTLS